MFLKCSADCMQGTNDMQDGNNSGSALDIGIGVSGLSPCVPNLLSVLEGIRDWLELLIGILGESKAVYWPMVSNAAFLLLVTVMLWGTGYLYTIQSVRVKSPHGGRNILVVFWTDRAKSENFPHKIQAVGAGIRV